jgi:hypothetical protein
MTAIRRIGRIAAGFGILALFAASRASAVCPENIIFNGCGNDAVGITSTTPTFSFEEAPWQAGDPCLLGCYDLPHGTIHARAQGNTASANCNSGVITQDLYEIVGLAPGPAVNFFAELEVTGSLTGPCSIDAELEEILPPGAAAAHSVGTPTPALHFVLHIPLVHAAGDQFKIQMSFSALGEFPDGLADANGVLRFGGLPAGASVQSCQTYELPVPTQPATWGALKSAYR